jgi:thymidylate kinase
MDSFFGTHLLKICIDGNDGTGKSTLISALKILLPQHEYQDRGLPSAMTVGDSADPADLYIILTCPVDVSTDRLISAGRDMTEHWHLPETLQKYHDMFIDLASIHGWHLVNSAVPSEKLTQTVQELLYNQHFVP